MTLVLKRSDQNGFERFLAAVQDPTSPQFHQYLTQSGLAERFGPSLSAYDAVKTWLADEGFTILEDSGNRLTLTASATRRQIEETFQVQLENYRLADRTFHANNTDPALPADIAPQVQAVIGLSNLAQPIHAHGTIAGAPGSGDPSLPLRRWAAQQYLGENDTGDFIRGGILGYFCMADILNLLNLLASGGPLPPTPFEIISDEPGVAPSPALAGAGQKIGLVQFDNFEPSDVRISST